MAEVKNSFLSSKMNKDLDDRLIPNGEYRNAVNVSINKSTGENVGTVQTVLGNEEIIDIGTTLGVSNLEFIGALPDDVSGNIFCFLTNNTLRPYITTGAVGVASTFPQEQGTVAFDGQILASGAGYGIGTAGSSGGTGSGIIFNIISVNSSGSITDIEVTNQGSGYTQGDVINLVTTIGSGASFIINTLGGPVSFVGTTPYGTNYTTSNTPGTTTAQGSSTGSGLTLNTTISAGSITSVTINNFGSGYAIGDTVIIDGGDNNAILRIDSILSNDNFIVSYNLTSTSLKVIAQGAFLNFSTLNPVTGINLLEKLLFFTDNRNQPRKVNIDREASVSNPAGDYYTTEEQLSVAKYYPYDPIQLYQPSQQTGAIQSTYIVDAVTNSRTLTLQTPTGNADPTVTLGSLGVNCFSLTITNGGTGYAPGNTISTGGNPTGTGLLINIVTVDPVTNAITAVSVSNPGSNYTSGTTVRVLQPSSGENAILTVDFITPNTFLDITQANWGTEITLNQPQTLPAGSSVNLVYPETTLQDAISEYLPVEASATIFQATNTTEFTLLKDSYKGDQLIAGTNLFVEDSSGNFNDTGSVVQSVAVVSTPDPTYGYLLKVEVLPAITNPDYLAAGGVTPPADLNVIFSISNPYFDQIFKENANVDFLNDKFVRFSYRFKFDDGEYSLMAPFTQPCFIPQQDGYFTLKEFGVDQADLNSVSDTDRTYRSTVVEFMQNKVNKILLNVPLPCAANDIISKYKIQEIDILYKESDQTTIKVVETVPIRFNVVGSGSYYQYEYGSNPPFKTLPQDETVRVYDKVPVKALAQEVASNRIIYGNYQDKHTPPKFLDYLVGSRSKTSPFTITNNGITDLTTSVEYPNASLKQNRNYEIGVVLSDRFGRQSTVLFSQTKLNFQSSFLASTVYSPYRSQADNASTSANPPNGLPYFDGNALRIQFNNLITSVKNEFTGTPGLYNSDITSADYNPLGWYSFKVVVKQTQQDYYNVYLPTAMAAYPLDETREVETTSHIVLYGDNINKVPRSLIEVGPQQREFGSDVRLFGRVNNIRISASGNQMQQYYPERASDSVSVIGTIKDLFDFREFPNLPNDDDYVFYNYDYTNPIPSTAEFTTSDGSSLIGRVNTEKQFGVPLPAGTGYFSNPPELNVFETSPVESLIDIYYETTTAGTIEDLNNAIETGPAANVFSTVSGGSFDKFNEGQLGQNSSGSPETNIEICEPFRPLRIGGAQFSNPSENECILNSVNNQLAQPYPNDSNEEGFPYTAVVTDEGIFSIQNNDDGSFNIILSRVNTAGGGSGPNNAPGLVVAGGTDPEKLDKSYTYDFDLTFTNPEAVDFNFLGFSGIRLGNIPPIRPIVEFPQAGKAPETLDCCTVNESDCQGNLEIFTKNELDITQVNAITPFLGVSGTNGSSTASLEKEDLTYSITYLAQEDLDPSSPTLGEFIPIYDPTSPVSAENSESALDGFFSILNYGPGGFQAGSGPSQIPSYFNDYQAIISIATVGGTAGGAFGVQGNTNVEANRIYQMRVTATDGGILNDNAQNASCQIRFKFSALPFVLFPYGQASEVPSGGSFLSPAYKFTPYTIDNHGNGQVWINAEIPPPTWGAWSNQSEFSPQPSVFCGNNLQVQNAPAKISIHSVNVRKGVGQNQAPNSTQSPLGNAFLLLPDDPNYGANNAALLNGVGQNQPGFTDIAFTINPNSTTSGVGTTIFPTGTITVPAGYGNSGGFNLRIDLANLANVVGFSTTTANLVVTVILKAEEA